MGPFGGAGAGETSFVLGISLTAVRFVEMVARSEEG
jgi:hypothetical protein